MTITAMIIAAVLEIALECIHFTPFLNHNNQFVS